MQQAAATDRQERRDALIASIPRLTLAELRLVASNLYIEGRSRMAKAALQDAILTRLQR